MKLTKDEIKKLLDDKKKLAEASDNDYENIDIGEYGNVLVVPDLNLLKQKLGKADLSKLRISDYFVKVPSEDDYDHVYKDRREEIDENNYVDVFDDFLIILERFEKLTQKIKYSLK